MAWRFRSLWSRKTRLAKRRERGTLYDVEMDDLSGGTLCRICGQPNDAESLKENLFVCVHCHYHFRIPPSTRIEMTLDPGTFLETSPHLTSKNPLEMEGYEALLAAAQEKTQLKEAVVTGTGKIAGSHVILGVMAFQFMGGSMGSVVGEKITRALLLGADKETPVILFTASGGARMQEGIFSLMQMAKTANAIALLEAAGVPLFVVLTDPTTGGVTASFAMLGDVTLAEPGALIGFAGPRVIEGTIKQKLPQGFQRAEFQKEKGFVDSVVPRSELRKALTFLLATHQGDKKPWIETKSGA